jgi:hypothetical protein
MKFLYVFNRQIHQEIDPLIFFLFQKYFRFRSNTYEIYANNWVLDNKHWKKERFIITSHFDSKENLNEIKEKYCNREKQFYI